MKKPKLIDKATGFSFVFFLVPSLSIADFTNWENSPLNFDNSEMNYENSSLNFNNSPINFQNNPMNFNSDRIVRDNGGDAIGYAVPKRDGGVNYFDLTGNRMGYQGGHDR